MDFLGVAGVNPRNYGLHRKELDVRRALFEHRRFVGSFFAGVDKNRGFVWDAFQALA